MMMWSITRRKNARRGFTLVELLAVIVILGILSMIGIASVSKLISKSKQTYLEQQEKNISMAAESYLQANTNAKPKSIGDSVNLSIKDLKSSNYLKEDITNSNGDSCMSNSFVRVYKYSKSEYSYTAYLYCGDDEVPDTIEVPSPTISVLLTDSSGNKNDQAVFDNVKSAVLKINMTGGSINDGSLVAIDGYYFSISTKSSASDEYTEVYNSGTLSANGKDSLSVNKTIGDYVNLTGDTYVSIKVVVTNVSGGKTEKNITTSDKSSEAIYNDKKAPECGESENITGAAEDDNDWINKKDAENGSNNSRTISIGCSDGEGSGCLRNKFTKTWPNKNTTDAEYSYITIKDNNGNTTDCRVRVNVDSTSPTISVNAYKATSSGGTTGNNVLTNTVKASDKNNSVEILATQYNNVAGGSWLNNANYPYGIIYSFNVSDNLHLYRWTWETNAGYINTAADGNYTTTSSSNPDSASGYFDNSKIDFTTANNGLTSSKVNVSFVTEGMRFGIFTVYDRAGNSTQIVIYANVDRTAPEAPSTIISTANSSTYTSSTWTNKSVNVQPDSNKYKYDNKSYNSVSKTYVEISGWSRFEYRIKKHAETSYSISNNALSYTFSITDKSFEGKNYISWRNCDKANNCSNYTSDFGVFIDTTNPKCNVTALKDGTTAYDSSWVSSGHYVLVKATCSDTGNSVSSKNSGCVNTNDKPSSFSFKYTTNISTTTAGAKGNNSGGRVYDVAGNYTDCSADKTVKVDVEGPKCTDGGDNNTWTKNAVTITWGCSDSGTSTTQSGCNSSYSGGKKVFNSNDYEIATWTADSYTIKDNAGNTTTCSAKVRNVYYDKKAPSVTCSMSSKTINVTKKSDGGSGLSTVKYAFGNSQPTSGYSSTSSTSIVCDASTKGYVQVTDKVGNTKYAYCGSYTAPGCCSSTTTKKGSWSSWGTCSKKCGTGTQSRSRTVTTVSKYNNSTCSTSTETESQSCNTQSCCSSTTVSSTGSWSGWSTCTNNSQSRTRTVYYKSTYNGASCGSKTETSTQSCTSYGKNNCKIRGNRITSQNFYWTCTIGHRHNTAYTHYCSDSNGNLQTKATNSSLVTYAFICPTSPYGTSDGWTIIND